MNNYFLLIILFLSISCSFNAPSKGEGRDTEDKLSDGTTVELLKISKQYCFNNGLCTGYISDRIDTQGRSIDSIVSSSYVVKDFFELEKIKKINVKESNDQDIINSFLKALIIANEYKMVNGSNRFLLPPDWFFEDVEFSKKVITGYIANGDDNESNFQINHLNDIKSIDLQIRKMRIIEKNRVEIFFEEHERLSIVFELNYFKSSGRRYFNDFRMEDRFSHESRIKMDSTQEATPID